MGVTPLYLEVEGRNVFILGTGEVATRRANRFLDKGANVVLAGESISKELQEKGAILKPLENLEELVEWSDFVILASGDEELSDHIASISREKLLNRADEPESGNMIVPTSFLIGDIEFSIFTNGKSPLMAKELRKRIQATITKEDILEIELQDYARTLLKEKVANQKDRREILYETLNNPEIQELLKDSKLEEARKLVFEMLEDMQAH